MSRTDPLKPRDIEPVPTLVPSVLPERLMGFLERGRQALGEPFRGVTTNGNVLNNLFPSGKTGVSSQAIVDAGRAFLASLDDDTRRQAMLPMESEAWREWCNIHPFLMRHGICLHLLPPAAQEAALSLLHASLGERGYALARGVMQLSEHLSELTGRPEEYGPWYYWLTIFGEPSGEHPWGWQIDGHHLNINAFLCGDQLVLTPSFLGSEPVTALTGKYAGLRVFAEEEEGGLRLMRSLSNVQQQKARIGDAPPRDVFGSAFCDNVVIPASGIGADALSAEQRELLLDLAAVYASRLPDGHAARLLAELRKHLAATTFAWMGGFGADDVFYYRIYSPVMLMEFCHQPGQALGDELPSRNHIHTMMRTPNGNDYGKAILRQYGSRLTS